MANLKSVRKKLEMLAEEQKALNRQLDIEETREKFKGTQDSIADNKDVVSLVKNMSSDELKIVMKKLYASGEFANLFRESLDECQSEIQELNFKKAEQKRKRELRKQNKCLIHNAEHFGSDTVEQETE